MIAWSSCSTGCIVAVFLAGTFISASPGKADEHDARAFVEHAEAELETLGRIASRTEFLNRTHATDENARLSEDAARILRDRAVALAKQAAQWEGVRLDADTARKLAILRLGVTIPAPRNPQRSQALAEAITKIEANYVSAENCTNRTNCRTKKQLYQIMQESRNPQELSSAWLEWRTPGRAIRTPYAQMVEIANEGARELKYGDVGALWRSHYDMPPDAFLAEYKRLWDQVTPLYNSLHCHVRARLRAHYGALVPERGLIPAHLFGNMWAQYWNNISDLVGPASPGTKVDITGLLRAKAYTPRDLVRTGESFFNSLGFPKLPSSFWERSMLEKPTTRSVNCHGSAWDIDSRNRDVRMAMCVEVDESNFFVTHHELGHIYYYLAYAGQPYLFRGGANPGFHEAIGDAVALSVTPTYLNKLGLLDDPPDERQDLPYLFRTALDKIPQLAMSIVVDLWRWQVFSGEIKPDGYNARWWDLRRTYQGIAPPVPRDEADFDGGMFYHISKNVPYDPYFTAHVLQFDFHRALCEAIGHTGPLHRCSIFGSVEAGRRLSEALRLGASRPWPDALEKLVGRRSMDGSSIVSYFAPIMEWLKEQNKERSCGW